MALVSVNKPARETPIYINCQCGTKILLIPDYEQMGRTIESHALEHKNSETDPIKAQAIFAHVQDQLILQVFEKVTKTDTNKIH